MGLLSKLFGKKENETKELKKSFEEIYNDIGKFTYTPESFQVATADVPETIHWEDITEIKAYKKDLMVYDLVFMEIICGEKVLTLNEESEGWFQFVLKLKEVFQSIPKDWDIKITQPPFAENLTVLYQKEK